MNRSRQPKDRKRPRKPPFKIIVEKHADGYVSYPVGLKVGFDRQEELLVDPRFFPTPYAAHRGWVSLRLQPKMDWAQVSALIVEAYRRVAAKRLLKLLDAD